MPRIINSSYYFTPEEIRSQIPNIKVTAIRKGAERFKNGVSKSYKCYSNESKGIALHIDIDSIPQKTKVKYQIPSGELFYHEFLYDKNNKLTTSLKEKRDNFFILNSWLKRQKGKYIDEYFCHGITLEIAYEYSNIHAIILGCLNLHEDKKISVKQVHELYLLKMKGKNPISSYSKFTKRFKQFREAFKSNSDKGLAKLILHGNTGKKNRKTITDLHEWFIEYYYSQPNKLSSGEIHYMVNLAIPDHNLETISLSTVKKYIAIPDVKNRQDKFRYGLKHYNQHVCPYIPRMICPYAGDVWMIDGTPTQFFYWDEQTRRRKRLTLFVVIDVFSLKIVGFHINSREDRYSVANSLQMAAQMSGFLPSEIVSDNFSANKTDEIKSLKSNFENIGVLWRHSKVGNAQDKTYVERFFGTLQSRIAKLYDDYIGEGITSKRKGARQDDNFIKKVYKAQGLPSEKELKKRLAEMIAKYNKIGFENSPSPNQKFNKSSKPNVKIVEPHETALVFWKTKIIAVQRCMIKMTVKGMVYHYEIADHDIKLKYNVYKARDKYKVIVKYDETDLGEIYIFNSQTNDFLCSCKLYTKPNLATQQHTNKDKNAIIQTQSRHDDLEDHIDQRNKEKLDKALDIAKDGIIETKNILSTDKYSLDDRESEQLLNYYFDRNNINKDEVDSYEPMNNGERFTNESDLEDIDDLFSVEPVAPEKLTIYTRNEGE